MDDLLITASLFALCVACALSIARRIINRRNVQRETKKNKHSLFSDGVSRSHTTAHLDSQSVKTRLPLRTKRTGQTAEKSAGPRIDTALALEILAAQLDSGLGLHQALTALADALPGTPPPTQRKRKQRSENAAPSQPQGTPGRLRTICAALTLGADWDTAWAPHTTDPLLGELGRILAPGYASGAPSATLLRHQADAHRTGNRRAAERAAGKLSVALVLPLGLCSLPAFICLSIIPILVSLLPTLAG